MTPKKNYSFMIDPELAEGLKVLKRRGASAINCYSGGEKLVPDRGGRQPARHSAGDRADAD